LETAVVAAAVLAAALALIRAAGSTLTTLAPAGAAAVLLLQQGMSADTVRPRSYVEIGLGRAQSEYLFHGVRYGTASGEDCSSPPVVQEYSRRHHLVVNSVLPAFRYDATKDRGLGVRAQLFKGEDQMSAADVRVGA